MSRSGIVQPDVYSYRSPDPIFPYGEALVSYGLENIDAINGYGAVSRGFLWQLYDIWIDPQFYDNLSTSWSNTETSITTTWTDSNSAVTTNWTSPQYGLWGEYTS